MEWGGIEGKGGSCMSREPWVIMFFNSVSVALSNQLVETHSIIIYEILCSKQYYMSLVYTHINY